MQIWLLFGKLPINLEGILWTGPSLVRSFGVMLCSVSHSLYQYSLTETLFESKESVFVTAFLWTTHTHTNTLYAQIQSTPVSQTSSCHASCHTLLFAVFISITGSHLLSPSSLFDHRDEAVSGELFITSCPPTTSFSSSWVFFSCLPKLQTQMSFKCNIHTHSQLSSDTICPLVPSSVLWTAGCTWKNMFSSTFMTKSQYIN